MRRRAGVAAAALLLTGAWSLAGDGHERSVTVEGHVSILRATPLNNCVSEAQWYLRMRWNLIVDGPDERQEELLSGWERTPARDDPAVVVYETYAEAAPADLLRGAGPDELMAQRSPGIRALCEELLRRS
ncbi:hypothetical protein [Streptomyces sp. NPDC026673]|uniref:hypothetical protein n=1 Tax=Streptomyces sp. NPDC026673 TaxID=3155724 RepID=UPI0033DA6A3A